MSLETPTNLPKRRRPRLPAAAYAQPGATCSVTISVQGSRPIFASADVATAAAGVLRGLAMATGVSVYGYCLMPDHVHLVIAPSPTCDIVTFVAGFKNLALRAAWPNGVQGSFWQKSFWDHFLRAEEDLERVVEYVLDNPVRRGLVKKWRDYPYCGSLALDHGCGHAGAESPGWLREPTGSRRRSWLDSSQNIATTQARRLRPEVSV